jgi:hypothetical protein
LAKLQEKPEELKVTVNVQGVPLTLAIDGETQRITKVYQNWRGTEEWWGKEITRNYFKVKTNKGLVCDIFRDMPAGGWYLSQIYD